LPAVTLPPSFTMGFSFASASIEVSRGCSSFETTTGSPFFAAIVTGTISSASAPEACAARARCCERSANASWSWRDTLKSSATFSAVSGIASMPYFDFIFGFTKRQPMVVS
jgi:hypothetical protein